MKDTIYSFKMLSLLIVLAFSNYSMAQEVSLKKQDVKTKEKITTHFSGHLSGNADAYKDKSTLKSTDVKKMQQIVMDAEEANNKFSEQKLINLDKLEKQIQENGLSHRNWNPMQSCRITGVTRGMQNRKEVSHYIYTRMVLEIKPVNGERESTYVKSSMMLHRFTSYLRSPIWAITIVGGKRQSNLLGKRCYV